MREVMAGSGYGLRCGKIRAVAQLGRAPASGSGGRGFKSHQPDLICGGNAKFWNGEGRFLLKGNPETGDVDEVKVLQSTGHVLLDEFSAKAFFRWKFQLGVVAQVQVPVEFYVRGFSRDLH